MIPINVTTDPVAAGGIGKPNRTSGRIKTPEKISRSDSKPQPPSRRGGGKIPGATRAETDPLTAHTFSRLLAHF